MWTRRRPWVLLVVPAAAGALDERAATPRAQQIVHQAVDRMTPRPTLRRTGIRPLGACVADAHSAGERVSPFCHLALFRGRFRFGGAELRGRPGGGGSLTCVTLGVIYSARLARGVGHMADCPSCSVEC